MPMLISVVYATELRLRQAGEGRGRASQLGFTIQL